MRQRVARIVLLIMAMCCIHVTVSTSQEDFLKANEFYRNGDYDKAEKLYDSIENKGAAVWFNLGNCCYHLQRYPESLAHWKRSLKTGGRKWRNDVVYNCQLVYEKLSLQQPQGFIESFVNIIDYYSLLWWQFMVILLGIIGTVMLIMYKSKKNISLILFFVLLGITTSGLGVKYWQLSREQAIVAYESGLMAGTDERFSKIATLKKGLEVSLVQKHDKWVKVATNGKTGWITTDALITI